jgi:hypothetical protein
MLCRLLRLFFGMVLGSVGPLSSVSLAQVTIKDSTRGGDVKDADDTFHKDSRFDRLLKTDRWSLDGTLIGLRYRVDEVASVRTRDLVEYQAKVRVRLKLSDKVNLIAEPQTGMGEFSGGWDNLRRVGDNSRFEDGFRLRRLYLDTDLDLGKDSYLQVGAIPSVTKDARSTPFALDNDGWVDGVRIGLNPKNEWVGQINITVGSLDTSDAAVYNRAAFNNLGRLKGSEFLQIQTVGFEGRRVSVLTEFNHFSDQNFLKASVGIDLRDITGLLVSNLVYENVIGIGSADGGQSVNLFKEGKKWRTHVAWVENRAPQDLRNLVFAPTRINGRHGFLLVERTLDPQKSWRWFLRSRVCADRNQCGTNFRAETGFRKRL